MICNIAQYSLLVKFGNINNTVRRIRYMKIFDMKGLNNMNK